MLLEPKELSQLRNVFDRSRFYFVQDYDTDKLFPALGFGARVPPEGKVYSLFQILDVF